MKSIQIEAKRQNFKFIQFDPPLEIYTKLENNFKKQLNNEFLSFKIYREPFLLYNEIWKIRSVICIDSYEISKNIRKN